VSSKIKNDYGTITIENEVIARVAGLAAMDCYGVVGMAAKNVKDGIVQLLRRESLTKGIQFSGDQEALAFDLHIIVEYGTNISAIAETLMETVKYKVEETIGLHVGRVNIFVEGVRVNR
jgi:uncharacterized alkaline shock family protein YloU